MECSKDKKECSKDKKECCEKVVIIEKDVKINWRIAFLPQNLFVMILTKNTRQKANCFLDVFALDEIQGYWYLTPSE